MKCSKCRYFNHFFVLNEKGKAVCEACYGDDEENDGLKQSPYKETIKEMDSENND